jgi:phosphoglycolate phosphatase
MTDLGALSGVTLAFDLDGTLVDSAPDLIGTLNVLLAQEGIAPLPLDEARPFIGHGARHLIRRGFDAQGAALDDERLETLFVRFLDHYTAHIADESRPFEGVPETLARLKAAGAELVVCTNKLTGLSVQVLDALDLSRFFGAVIGADAAPAAKPDPRHLQAAVEAVGGDLRRTVMVGDAATDAGAARAARAGLVLVSFGYSDIPVDRLDPDVLIHRFADLPEAILDVLGACPAESSGL